MPILQCAELPFCWTPTAPSSMSIVIQVTLEYSAITIGRVIEILLDSLSEQIMARKPDPGQAVSLGLHVSKMKGRGRRQERWMADGGSEEKRVAAGCVYMHGRAWQRCCTLSLSLAKRRRFQGRRIVTMMVPLNRMIFALRHALLSVKQVCCSTRPRCPGPYCFWSLTSET